VHLEGFQHTKGYVEDQIRREILGDLVLLKGVPIEVTMASY
jgi:hypothetical protein